jgi:hypothetical protein
MSEILPRPPNTSSKIAPTTSQCQRLKEPMKPSVRACACVHPGDREFNLKLGVEAGKNKLNRQER